MQQIFDRLQALLSRKFIAAVVAMALVTFGLDSDPEWTAAADAVIAAIYALAQAYQNSKLPK
jgi:predicted phage gp36 major capsid-like protein